MKRALPPIVTPNSKVLIVGAMPVEKSIAQQQYYANKSNQFWKILFEVFETPFSDDYDTRKKSLRTNKIALWNVLAFCERKGSADHNIRNECANDFLDFHRKYPNIEHVCFESKSAANYFLKHRERNSRIAYHVLPSKSALYAGMKYADKLAAWQILPKLLL